MQLHFRTTLAKVIIDLTVKMSGCQVKISDID